MRIAERTAVVLAVATMIGAAGTMPAQAHHSFAMFDQTKLTTKRKATVTEFRWTNPHSFVVVSVKEGNRTVRYTLECNSVNMMTKAGWRRNTIKAGDTVDVVFHPLRNGRPGGMLNTITLPDGRKLGAW